MTNKLYVIYNKVSETYGDILEMHSNAIAARWFDSWLKANSEKHKDDNLFNPDDHEMFCVGETERNDRLFDIKPFLKYELVASSTFADTDAKEE